MLRTSPPSIVTRPLSGSTMRLKQRSSDVLPEPLSPTSASREPGSTCTVTDESAETVP